MNLTGRIDGHLEYGRKMPAIFRLDDKEIDPDILLRIGELMESLRLGDFDGYTRAQYEQLMRMGASPDLIETLMRTKMKVEVSIRNGAGSSIICKDMMRFLREMATKGDDVSTHSDECAISAGAYMWMSAPKRSTGTKTRYLWHTRTPHPEGATEEDKAGDLTLFRPFFEGAEEPLRSRFLYAIDEDDNNCHEITTTGAVLIRAGLAERLE